MHKKRTKRPHLALAGVLLALWLPATAFGDLVRVREQTSAGTEEMELAETVVEIGTEYLTQTAPEIEGYVFARWTSSVAETLVARDRWGRALDAAKCTVGSEVVLTAEYLPEGEDTDGDGVADGLEIYWYGNLAQTGTSDTDRDGFTFAEEMTAGTNPLFADVYAPGGMQWGDSSVVAYNPLGYQPYTIRSEPEGVLFETVVELVRPGTVIDAPTQDHLKTAFAYWMMDGVRQADRWGRALDAVSFTMSTSAVEVVAVTVANGTEREQGYWYGCAQDMDSDTDGDGYTFAEEIAAGMNPLFADVYTSGGVQWGDSALLYYNRGEYGSYTLRSEPEGALFETVLDIVRSGTVLTPPPQDHTATAFAYWTVNGVRQADRWGRALDTVSFTMPTGSVEVVAMTVGETTMREQLYWYGEPVGMDSDTDGDGFTLAEELVAGTNPLFVDTFAAGGMACSDSELLHYTNAPVPVVTFEGETCVLMGSLISLQFTLENYDGAVTWSLEGYGRIDGNGLYTLREEGPGPYTITVTALDEEGVAIAATSVILTGRAPPQFMFEGDSTGTVGTPVAFRLSASWDIALGGCTFPEGSSLGLDDIEQDVPYPEEPVLDVRFVPDVPGTYAFTFRLLADDIEVEERWTVEVATVPPAITGMTLADGTLSIEFEGAGATVWISDDLETWTEVPTATSPFTLDTDSPKRFIGLR